MGALSLSLFGSVARYTAGLTFAILAAGVWGCQPVDGDSLLVDAASTPSRDLIFVSPREADLGDAGYALDLIMPASPCGDYSPFCEVRLFDPPLGSPFPLSRDYPGEPSIGGSGLVHDINGYLILDPQGGANGRWSFVIKGWPGDSQGLPGDTIWKRILFAADVPANTRLTVKARSGNSPVPDNTFGAWISDQSNSPVDLIGGAALKPNVTGGQRDVGDAYLEVEVDFQTSAPKRTPRLRSLEVAYECPNCGPA